MNRSMMIGSIMGAVAVTAAGSWAGFKALDAGEYAEVVAVDPAMKTVSIPREDCRNELVTHKKAVKDPKQITGTVAGAVIGGVLGNQVGGGRGKDIATVAGAVGGGYAGNKIQENIQENNVEQSMQTVCSTVYDQREEQDGYNVTYRLNDQERTIHMAYNPGNRIPVQDGVLIIDPAS
jgi:uncharacterized protein YcfJ